MGLPSRQAHQSRSVIGGLPPVSRPTERPSSKRCDGALPKVDWCLELTPLLPEKTPCPLVLRTTGQQHAEPVADGDARCDYQKGIGETVVLRPG